jgi:hypothetical protein
MQVPHRRHYGDVGTTGTGDAVQSGVDSDVYE